MSYTPVTTAEGHLFEIEARLEKQNEISRYIWLEENQPDVFRRGL